MSAEFPVGQWCKTRMILTNQFTDSGFPEDRNRDSFGPDFHEGFQLFYSMPHSFQKIAILGPGILGGSVALASPEIGSSKRNELRATFSDLRA